jgi:uncharacterized protein (DUF1499 family)
MVLRSPLHFVLAGLFFMPLFSFTGTRPANLGVHDSRLSPCPASPNCASSDDADAGHGIPAFQLIVPAGEAWREARAIVASLSRTEIVSDGDDYLHAECSSAFFGFVDDLELHLRARQNFIAVRSAARLGHSDFGVNRKRIEKLRSLLVQRRVIR